MFTLPAIGALAKANWKLIVIAAAVLAVFSWHKLQVSSARSEGYKAALENVDKAANSLTAKADEGTKTVEACFAKGEPWVWNRSLGKCVKP